MIAMRRRFTAVTMAVWLDACLIPVSETPGGAEDAQAVP